MLARFLGFFIGVVRNKVLALTVALHSRGQPRLEQVIGLDGVAKAVVPVDT